MLIRQTVCRKKFKCNWNETRWFSAWNGYVIPTCLCVCGPEFHCVPTLSSVPLTCISVLLSCPPNRDPRTVNSLLHLTTRMCISLNGCGWSQKAWNVCTWTCHAITVRSQWNHRQWMSKFVHSFIDENKNFLIKFVANAPYSGIYCRNGSVPFRLCWHGKKFNTNKRMAFAYWAKSQPSTQRKRAASCLATFYLLLWPSGHSSSSQRICRRFIFTTRFMTCSTTRRNWPA